MTPEAWTLPPLNGSSTAMTVSEANRKAIHMKRLGRALMGITALQFAMFTVLFAYQFGALLSRLIPKLGYGLQDMCNLIYQKTTFLLPLWKITPLIDIYRPWSIDTLFLFGIVVVFTMGAYIRDCGRKLAADVAEIRKKARDELWLRSMLPQDQATVINQPANVLILSLPMPPEVVKNWWERPPGILLMGLAITYIGALVTKVTGLT
jgi:hypothetical protein